MRIFGLYGTKFLHIAIMGVLIFVFGCGENSEDGNKSLLTPVLLLPDDDEISGWKTIGAYEEANDYDSLYALIDGGAEVYIDNGFISAVFQIYQQIDGVRIGALLHLRIYDQGNETNAKTTYEKVSTGISIPWIAAGTEARIDESGLASYTVEFWQRNFYVQVIIEEKSDDSLNIAKLFASHISGKIR